MKNEKKQGLTRREFHKLSGSALLATGVVSLARGSHAAHHETGNLVTDVASQVPVLESLQYVHVSEKEGQQCANCILYTAGEGGLGKCQILPEGQVKETGWCLSWSKKP